MLIEIPVIAKGKASLNNSFQKTNSYLNVGLLNFRIDIIKLYIKLIRLITRYNNANATMS